MPRRKAYSTSSVTSTSSKDNVKLYSQLHEASSMDLLRHSIIRCIEKKQNGKLGIQMNLQRPNVELGNYSPGITSQNIEVKFLKQLSPFFSSKNSNDAEPSLLSDTLETKWKENGVGSKERLSTSRSFQYVSADENENEPYPVPSNKDFEESSSKSDIASENNLRLALRSSSESILEDCSTYNINCDHMNHERQISNSRNDFFSKSDLHQNRDASNISPSTSENYLSEYDKLDDLTPLSDTFFPHVINENSMKLAHDQKYSRHTKEVFPEKTTWSEVQEPKKDEVISNEDNRKYSRRIRRKTKKSKSKEPYVYQCPKCKVSYTIPTKVMNDFACCLHCDLWTSVEPIFLKREKQSWNTCILC